MKDVEEYYINERKDLCSLIPEGSLRILEIGCGSGNFRNNIHSDCEYWGVEPVSEVAQEASTKLDHVLCGVYEEVAGDIPDNYFDLVVCNDVIEHMAYPEIFLRSVRKKMKSDVSYIIGSIPNVRYIENLYNLLIKRDWRYMDWGVLDNTHLRFFTRKSMIRLFESEGFKVELSYGTGKVPFSFITMKSFLKSIGARVFCLVFGLDTAYSQFAFRAKQKIR